MYLLLVTFGLHRKWVYERGFFVHLKL